MQFLFILPITYFINRLLYPYNTSYIRLSYDETALIEFYGSKLKINPFLSHFKPTYPPLPFILYSFLLSFSLTLQNSCTSISLFVCGSFLHIRTSCDSLPPLKTRRVSPPQPAVAGCGSPLHEQQQRAAFPPQQPPTILP